MKDATDKELISHALTMWANHIETGNVGLSAIDVYQQNKSLHPASRKVIRPLDVDQMQLVVRLRKLAARR